MDAFGLCLSLSGLLLLAYRIWPRHQKSSAALPLNEQHLPLISIIVPARNEETVIPALLESLKSLDYPRYEVLVLNDCSEDRTAEVVERYPFTLISGKERPESWKGKQWACHQAAQQAKGDYLLFTDADTIHHPQSLRQALSFLLESNGRVMSSLPFHSCQSLWEKLCGPFHVLLLAGTAPFSKPRKGQVFAIGQYLFFEKSFYHTIGGHEAVKAEMAEDIALANRCLELGYPWLVYRGGPLFEVRMYARLIDFIRGWRRNFRAGMARTVPWAPLEMVAFMSALLPSGQWRSLPSCVIWLLSWFVVARSQRLLGRFSLWGILLGPLALGLFICVTLLAIWDMILQRPATWKNRSYAVSLPKAEH